MSDVTPALRQVSPPEITAESVAATATKCPFCLEEIKAGASVCKHCGGALSPVHQLMLARAALEARLAAVEANLASLRQVAPAAMADLDTQTGSRSAPSSTGWPHMVDNLFLG